MTAEIVYESPRVTVWHGDAGEVLPGLRTESLDLLLTDPPYGDGYESGRRAERFGQITMDTLADREDHREILRHAVRVIGQHRHLYVFGPAELVDGLKVSATTELIWDKGSMGMGDLTSPWGSSHERITFGVSKHRHAGEAGKGSQAVRLRKGSVLRFDKVTGRKLVHPNQKPVPLLRELLESSSRQGETVLDPYAGSGSTAVAAVLCGRRAVLVEKDAQWLPHIIDRVRAAEALADQF